ncbi:MAG: glycosyltransferase family 4 protein [Gammaproteobacteria bacterium]|nr:glycosyltransferase family 4 protein [Gammaproteobacteria bacterium]
MPKLAIVLKGYPRLSETFIAQEILNLERAGFDITLYSLRLPTDNRTHPVHGEIGAGVVYLPEYLYRQPGRVLRSWWRCRRLAGYPGAWKQFLRDLMRDPSPNRVRRFGQAFVLAAELPRDMPALYAHFLHTPASVARYAAILRGLPWACSAHAKDIHTTPDWEITEKLTHCRWLTTCTSYNAEHLSRLAPPGKVMLNYHGLDLGRFGSAGRVEAGRNGGDGNDPVRLLSVGRAVEKKGYDGLLRALAALGPDLSWRLVHIGGGPLQKALREQAESLCIQQFIEWHGPQPQEYVLARYRESDLFVLNSRIDRHGDRDGLPNVIVEAQSQGLSVIATNLSGIPELVESGVNGLLVPPEDESALTGALDNLIRNPEERTRMGASGREKVQGGFTMEAAFQPLCRQLQELAAGSPPA